ATCTEEGEKKCKKCGAKVSIHALGHDYKTTTEPTCFATGLKTCKNCNATETIAKISHNFDTKYTSDGTNHWYACLNNGCTERKGEEIHSWASSSYTVDIDEYGGMSFYKSCVECDACASEECDDPEYISEPVSYKLIIRDVENNCIPDDCFEYLQYLTEITIPDTVTSIGRYAFLDCDGLTKIVIPESVTEIREYAFERCSALEEVEILGPITEIDYQVFFLCPALKTITLPNTVKIIDDYAFYGCEALTSITLPSGLEKIGQHAFQECKALKSLTIPNSVTYLGSSFACKSGLEEVVLPTGITDIPYMAFSACYSLSSVTIPSSVTTIGDYAFENCSSLNSLTYLGNAEDWAEIGLGYAWANINEIKCKDKTLSVHNHGLTYMGETDPDSCASDGNKECWYCYNCDKYYLNALGNVEADYETEIRKPKANHTITYRTAKDATCTEAGYNAHYYCTVCNGAFTDEDGTNVYTDYTQATGHNNDSGIYLVDLDSNYYYYDSDFYKYCDRCGSALGNKIDYYALPSSWDFVLKEGLTRVYDGAFSCSNKLKSIVIPSGVTEIGSSAFENCSNLESVTLSDTVITIETSAFSGCTNLTQIELPDSLTTIGKYAFDSSGLTSITIPSSVTSIDDKVFQNCDNLTSITYEGTKAQWNSILTGQLHNTGANYSCQIIFTQVCNHSIVIEPAVPATCIERGKTEGRYCSICGEVFAYQMETPLSEHTEETIPGKAATCTEAGLKDGKKCSVCGEVTQAQETITALGHDKEHHAAVAPSCDEGNKEYWECSRCGKYFSDAGQTEITEAETIIPTQHSYSLEYFYDEDSHWKQCTLCSN
ncbi:MAG: leucine-rich repeat domain-containing protein, partial [Sphaerochaetaceae bacterium]|nr:leucine-rich repeat domain-containing protein [Sphaerochaetaceae bacterium]